MVFFPFSLSTRHGVRFVGWLYSFFFSFLFSLVSFLFISSFLLLGFLVARLVIHIFLLAPIVQGFFFFLTSNSPSVLQFLLFPFLLFGFLCPELQVGLNRPGKGMYMIKFVGRVD